MLTQIELERILAVAKDNAGLRKQLEGLKTTWQLVDSDFASLVSERAELSQQQQKLNDEYERVSDQVRRVNKQIDVLMYGESNIGISTAGINAGIMPQQQSIKATTGQQFLSQMENAKQNSIKTQHAYKVSYDSKDKSN